MSLLGALENVGLHVGKRVKHAASEMPQGAHFVRDACDLPNCAQPATQVFDSVRVEGGPLRVCSSHASDVRRWVG